MTDTPKRSTATTARRPDCVTEVRRGNTVLVVSGYFKQKAQPGEQPPMPCKATFLTENQSTLCAIK